jgi:hypothetical protein
MLTRMAPVYSEGKGEGLCAKRTALTRYGGVAPRGARSGGDTRCLTMDAADRDAGEAHCEGHDTFTTPCQP